MQSDSTIAAQVQPQPITDIAARLGVDEQDLMPYGKLFGKIHTNALTRPRPRPGQSKLILVSATTPTAAGEGKTTTSIGLGQAFGKLGESVCVALREPSLGPCLGVKGGATGGGYAQVLPADRINLHFTGDFHAITSANNLISASIDNHIYWDNELGLDPRMVVWRRVMDMNDRSLRQIVLGLGGRYQGTPREGGFDITAASEIMAILCLSRDLDDLRKRLDNILIGTWTLLKMVKKSLILLLLRSLQPSAFMKEQVRQRQLQYQCKVKLECPSNSLFQYLMMEQVAISNLSFLTTSHYLSSRV